jgi:predicted ATP-binding protein involved in virulence
MKVNKIHLQNFKGFEDIELNFNPNMTVLIGDNGTGKSSILDALAFVLGTYFWGVDGISNYSLKQTYKRRFMAASNSLEYKLPLKISVENTLHDKNYSWYRDTNKSAGGSTSYKNASDFIAHAKEITEAVRNGDDIDLPLIAYYGTERLSVEIHEKQAYAKQSSRLDAYKDALDHRLSTKKFMEWFKTTEISNLQPGEESEKSLDKGLYLSFVGAISSMLIDYTNIHFNVKQNDIVGLYKDGTWRRFDDLSDGYKNIVRLSLDIAYKAIKLNPHLGSEAVINAKGVVLIDEIDMHLHPKWQKTIIADLKRTFPNIQFITTTHSPFIVQSLKAGEIINLDNRDIDRHPDSMTLNENALYMGVDSDNSQVFDKEFKIAKNFFELLKEEVSDEILEKINYLIEETSDPVLKAKLTVERMSKYYK